MTHTPARYLVVLDVGHGNCCIVKDDNGVVVIDTGLGTTLLEFLTANGIKSVDVVLLSHADQDHISGLVQLLASNEVSVGRVRLNTAAKNTRLWKNLLGELEDQERQGKLNWQIQLTSDSGEDYSLGRVKIDILAPGKKLAGLGPGGRTDDNESITTNTVSCVVHLSQGADSIAVIPGDIDDVGLKDLVRRLGGQRFAVPILVFPHHGGLSGTGPSPDFAASICDLFQPRTVIFSIGRGKYATPRPDVVEAVRRQARDVRIACTQLSEHCSVSTPQDDPVHLLHFYSEGKSERSCCAGTMLVDLDAAPNLVPSEKEHAKFVERNAAKALCRRPLPPATD